MLFWSKAKYSLSAIKIRKDLCLLTVPMMRSLHSNGLSLGGKSQGGKWLVKIGRLPSAFSAGAAPWGQKGRGVLLHTLEGSSKVVGA